MTDANLKSPIHVTNNLAIDSLTITPVLYLSNGRRFALPEVKIPPSGTAVLSVNDALQLQGIAPWGTLFGYVEIEYRWPWDAICATVRNTDVAHSLVFAYNLRAPLPANPQDQAGSPPGAHVVEGMWWKQESGVTGFVALSNTQSQPVTATVEATDNAASVFAKHTVKISPYGTKMVLLQELKQSAGSEGGIRVTYDGAERGLMINGGLEDQSTGYSANLPFASASPAWTKVSRISYAEVG